MTVLRVDKRASVLRAALELIAELGFHGAPTAMIAEKAGVGMGTIYRYFENKDMLINELYKELEEKFFKYLMQGYVKERPIKERFFHIARGLLGYLIENPMEFRFIEQFHNSPYGVAIRRNKILAETSSDNEADILRELFEQGKAQQVIKNLPLALFCALFFGPLLSVVRDHILGFIKLDGDLVELIVEACWDAVKM